MFSSYIYFDEERKFYFLNKLIVHACDDACFVRCVIVSLITFNLQKKLIFSEKIKLYDFMNY